MNLIKNAKNNFSLLKKFKNTESAQLWNCLIKKFETYQSWPQRTSSPTSTPGWPSARRPSPTTRRPTARGPESSGPSTSPRSRPRRMRAVPVPNPRISMRSGPRSVCRPVQIFSNNLQL